MTNFRVRIGPPDTIVRPVVQMSDEAAKILAKQRNVEVVVGGVLIAGFFFLTYKMMTEMNK